MKHTEGRTQATFRGHPYLLGRAIMGVTRRPSLFEHRLWFLTLLEKLSQAGTTCKKEARRSIEIRAGLSERYDTE